MMDEKSIRYAVQFPSGLQIIDNDAELRRLAECGVSMEILGTVCDSQTFGDNCSTDCPLFRDGKCPSTVMRDYTNQLWHVMVYEIHNSYRH